VAQAGTSIELEISTRGASSCVSKTPTAFPDWTSIVSFERSRLRVSTMVSNASQLRAARPVPPYTMSSSGFSATSGSRLFSSIRSTASWTQPRQRSVEPRAARIVRAAPGPAATVALMARDSIAPQATVRRGRPR
jgi:hypothetical protein